VTTQQQGVILKQKVAITNAKLSRALDFLTSQAVRNKVLFFINHPVLDIFYNSTIGLKP
jgi:hypothetical protein